jgi:hypothetical protein
MIRLVCLTLTTCIALTSICQDSLPPAPADKSVVYFARTSALGFAINFTYFDSATVIGKSNGANYIRYECIPGTHLFWGRSENRDYIEADLEGGKIYFIEAIPQMGAIKAGLKLEPVDPTNEKTMKRIWKLLNKKEAETFSAEQLQEETKKMASIIERGLEQYQLEKNKGKKQARLEKAHYYKNAGEVK